MNGDTGRVTRMDVSLLLLRLIVGVVFMAHGSQKLFGAFEGPGIAGFAGHLEKMNMPLPEAGAWAAALAEFGGGLLVLLGLFTRLGALAIIGVMAVAIATVHIKAFFLPAGMEFALTLLVVNLALLISGGGKLSVTGMMRGECCRSRVRMDA